MIYLLFIILAALLTYQQVRKKTKDLAPEERAKVVKKALWIFAAILLAISAFAKGNVIMGAIATAFAFILRLLPVFLKIFPFLKLLTSASKAQAGQQKHPAAQPDMDKQRAADILGVGVEASEEEIISAHKRLMQKVHPDKGGSEALAVEINTAKEVMLNQVQQLLPSGCHHLQGY